MSRRRGKYKLNRCLRVFRHWIILLSFIKIVNNNKYVTRGFSLAKKQDFLLPGTLTNWKLLIYLPLYKYIRLSAASNNSSFLKINNSRSCDLSPQQIVGGLRPQMICGWPRGPAKCWLLAQRASKSLQTSKITHKTPLRHCIYVFFYHR